MRYENDEVRFIGDNRWDYGGGHWEGGSFLCGESFSCEKQDKEPYWTKFCSGSNCDWCGGKAKEGDTALYYRPNKAIMCEACAKKYGARKNIMSEEIVLRKKKREGEPYWIKAPGYCYCCGCGKDIKEQSQVLIVEARAGRAGSRYCQNCGPAYEAKIKKENQNRKRKRIIESRCININSDISCEFCSCKIPEETRFWSYHWDKEENSPGYHEYLHKYVCDKCRETAIKRLKANYISKIETWVTSLDDTKEKEKEMNGKTTAQKLIGEPKKDAGEAAYRVAADQLVKTVKGPVITRLTAGTNLKDDVALVLSTEPGEALLGILLAAAVDMTPAGDEKLRSRLAHELRVAAYTKVGTQLADLIGEPVREALATVKLSTAVAAEENDG